jgi:hypothetical protein
MLRVIDRRLGHAICLVPPRGAQVQLGNHFRFSPSEFGVQGLPKQIVIAIPLAPSVERHNQQVASLETIEDTGRAIASDDGVAQRTGEPIEDRGTGEKGNVGAETWRRNSGASSRPCTIVADKDLADVNPRKCRAHGGAAIQTGWASSVRACRSPMSASVIGGRRR